MCGAHAVAWRPAALGSRTYLHLYLYDVGAMVPSSQAEIGRAADAFLASMGITGQQQQSMRAAPRDPIVAIVSCSGLLFGGAQLRCSETAYELTARGLKTECIDGFTSMDKPGYCYCNDGVDQLAARPSLKTVVFLRKLPTSALGYASKKFRAFRERSNATIILDTMDFQAKHHCQVQALSQFVDAAIFDSRWARARVLAECKVLKATNFFFIEHFHSSVRRVGFGQRPHFRNVLLLQEHTFYDRRTCGRIRELLPPSVRNGGTFACHAINPAKRSVFIADQLGIPRAVVDEVRSRPNGTGALFTAVFAKYDMLINWRAANGTVQRLANFLASGVPVVTLWSEGYSHAFQGHTMMYLREPLNYEQLGSWSHALAESHALRRIVSEEGFQAAEKFSRANIMQLYRRCFCSVGRAKEVPWDSSQMCESSPIKSAGHHGLLGGRRSALPSRARAHLGIREAGVGRSHRSRVERRRRAASAPARTNAAAHNATG